MNRSLPLLFASAMLFSSNLTIADDNDPKANSITYRQSTFKMVKWHVGPMVAMVKGKVDYDAAAFTKNAEAVASLSKLASNGFMIESLSKKSQSKPAIWKNKSDFDQKMQDFVDASGKLLAAAQTNNLDTIKPAMGAMGKTCKSCHKEYRVKKK